MPGWLVNALRETDLDLAKAPGYSYEKTETLLAAFEKNVSNAREAIAAATDESLDVVWSLKMGEKVLHTAPRRIVIRQHLNHLVHHRGQLSVYLRLVDVPLPSIYGPTADERWT
jgi:uncharacterized damage-inducible protein DinB